jgi:hypothetical protein
MSDPIYFVVLKGPKGIYAAKYHDHLPSDKYSRNPSFEGFAGVTCNARKFYAVRWRPWRL